MFANCIKLAEESEVNMAAAGISTLGITFGYGVETTAGEKPTTFKQLTRINARQNKILSAFFIMITVRIKIFVDIKHNCMYYM